MSPLILTRLSAFFPLIDTGGLACEMESAPGTGLRGMKMAADVCGFRPDDASLIRLALRLQNTPAGAAAHGTTFIAQAAGMHFARILIRWQSVS